MNLQELLILMLVILAFSITGLWPRIIRGLRELHGERFDDDRAPPMDLELCYKLLGLSPSASWEEIERAYRAKAKVHHPDRGGDEDAMRALNDAYARLKQIHRRG
ncbi:MAG: J domain-containing protein [Candidatus Hydrogenedentes bacterium]|nr:J domain-containing protein [Candidatus Hydrogenedentota bacterium]